MGGLARRSKLLNLTWQMGGLARRSKLLNLTKRAIQNGGERFFVDAAAAARPIVSQLDKRAAALVPVIRVG
jgi:hypothetical protein